MNHNTMAAALLLALSGFGSAVWAQPATTPTASEQAPAPTAKEPSTAATPAPRAEERPIAEANGSPYDYQSSEEISEDLSVSFPVDI